MISEKLEYTEKWVNDIADAINDKNLEGMHIYDDTALEHWGNLIRQIRGGNEPLAHIINPPVTIMRIKPSVSHKMFPKMSTSASSNFSALASASKGTSISHEEINSMLMDTSVSHKMFPKMSTSASSNFNTLVSTVTTTGRLTKSRTTISTEFNVFSSVSIEPKGEV